MASVNSQIGYLESTAGAALTAVESAARELASAGRLPSWGVIFNPVEQDAVKVQVTSPVLGAFDSRKVALVKSDSVTALFTKLIAPLLRKDGATDYKTQADSVVKRVIESDELLQLLLSLVKPIVVQASSSVFAMRNARLSNEKLSLVVSSARGVGLTSAVASKLATVYDTEEKRQYLIGKLHSIGAAAVERTVSAIEKVAITVLRNAEISATSNSVAYDAAVVAYVQRVTNMQRRVQLDAAYVASNVAGIAAKVDADVNTAKSRIRATSAAADAMSNVASAALSAQTAILGAIGSAT